MSDSFELFSNADNEEDDYEYERLTSSEVLEKLEEAWHNEKFAPDLLPHKTEFISSMLEQIRIIEESVETHSREDYFMTSIQRLEMDRIRFVICSYLRTRLNKIEKYIWHILKQESSSDSAHQLYLSPEELEYAKQFSQNLESHFQSLILKNVPSNLQQIDQKKAIPHPNMLRYVFIKGINRKDNVLLDPSDTSPDPESITIEANSQFILPYQPISALVKNGDMRLI